MSVWSRIIALAAKAFEEPGDAKPMPPSGGLSVQDEACAADADDVGFTAAVIGLAAKMAKSDGAVSDAEIAAAAAVFKPPPGEEENFRRVFRLAQQTVHGFDSYARQIGKRYSARPCLLEDVLDGLFHIAVADGVLSQAEDAYLAAVAQAFGMAEGEYRRIRASNLGEGGLLAGQFDPYTTLGLTPDATAEEVKMAWRRLVQENHPDRMIGRGAPAAFVKIAEQKTAAINAAFRVLQGKAAGDGDAGAMAQANASDGA
jgi:DnaJ like chaperone protein